MVDPSKFHYGGQGPNRPHPSLRDYWLFRDKSALVYNSEQSYMVIFTLNTPTGCGWEFLLLHILISTIATHPHQHLMLQLFLSLAILLDAVAFHSIFNLNTFHMCIGHFNIHFVDLFAQFLFTFYIG